MDKDTIYRIAVETEGNGLSAQQLDNLSSVKIDTLSEPTFVALQQLEDKINYSVDWKYTIPDAVFAEKYVFQMDDNAPQDVANGVYDAAANIGDVLDGKYQVDGDLLNISVQVDLRDNYDEHNVKLTAIGNEKYTEADAKAAAEQGNRGVLFLTSAPAEQSVQVHQPTGTPTLVFDPDARDGQGDYVLSWPRCDGVKSYEVNTNAVTNNTVTVPQVAAEETPETSLTKPEGINVNDDGPLTITNRGSGTSTISSAIFSSKLYHAAELTDKVFNPYTGELSWTDPTDINKMPSGYESNYLVRITDAAGKIVYYPTTETSINLFDIEDNGAKIIVDGVKYDIEVINTGAPKTQNTQQVYGEYFGEDNNIVVEDLQYGTYTINVKAYTDEYRADTLLASTTTQTRDIAGAEVSIYANGLPELGEVTPDVLVTTDAQGNVVARLPYGTYGYSIDYSETILEEDPATEIEELLISTFSDAAAPGELAPVRTFTVDAAAKEILAYIMRDPLVALDRTQNLTLVTDGPTDGWKFVFAPTPNANVDPNSAYKVTYNVGDTPNTQTGHEDNGQIAIGLSGLFDQTTTSPTTGSVDIITSARSSNAYKHADWADSATRVTLEQLEQPVITGFTKESADEYTISWDAVADASYYRVVVDGNDPVYTPDLSYTVTLDSAQDAAADVEVTAIYDTDNDPDNGITKTAVYNKDAVRTLEQKDDNADNPYWAATIYVDSVVTDVTIDRQENVDNDSFELTTDAEFISTLSWAKASELNKYDVSIDGGEAVTVTSPATEVEKECEVSVTTKGNYDPEELGADVTTLYADSVPTVAQVHQSEPQNIAYSSDNIITWTDDAAFANLDQNTNKDEYITYTVTIYNTFDNNKVVAEETVQAKSNDECQVKIDNAAVDSDLCSIVITSETARYSLILGSFGSQNSDFKKVSKVLTLYDPVNKKYVEGEAQDLITISTNNGPVYTLNKIDKNGRTVYLVEGGQYTVSTKAFTSNDNVEYKANDQAASYVISKTYPGSLLVYVYPVDYIALDKSEKGVLSPDGNTLTVSAVTTADKGETPEAEIGNLSYALYGVDGPNGAEEKIADGVFDADSQTVTYDLSSRDKEYSYYISRAHSDITNSVDSDTIIVATKLAAPSGIRVERSAETGKITAYWNTVANATGYNFNNAAEDIQTNYAELTGNTVSVIARGNADGVTEVAADSIGIINFYLDSEPGTKSDIAVTATIKVGAVDSVTNKALQGALRLVSVNEDGESTAVLYDNEAVPTGGMYIFLPDGNYRASFYPAADYDGLYDAVHGVEFSVTNGVMDTTPAELIFQAVPEVQQVAMNIGVFLNHAPLSDAQVTITQTNAATADYAQFNGGEPYEYTTDGTYKALTMPEGEYAAKVVAANGDVLVEAYAFTVSAAGAKTVDINFFLNAVPIKVVDAVTGETIKDSVEVTFTGATHNKVHTVADDNSKVQLYSDEYTVSVAEGEYDGVDYEAYSQANVVVSESAPSELVIKLVPKDAVILDTSADVTIEQLSGGAHNGEIEIAFAAVTTYNNGNEFATDYPDATIEFALKALADDGSYAATYSHSELTVAGKLLYHISVADWEAYKANGFALVATINDPENTVANPSGSVSVVSETALATPEFNPVTLENDQEYKLTWNAVENAASYTYGVNGAETTGYTETYLKPVHGGEAITVQAVPDAAALFGQTLTATDGVFNYYLPSEVASTTIAVNAFVPIQVKDGHTGKAVDATVTIAPQIEGSDTQVIAAGGSTFNLPVGTKYTVTVNKADAALTAGVAYAEDSLTVEFTVAQSNMPVVLTFDPADSQQLPKSAKARYEYEADDSGLVKLVFSKVVPAGDADAVVSYSLIGVAANGLEEVISDSPSIGAAVNFRNVDPAAYESYKLLTSAVSETTNYIASETAVNFAQLATPAFGDVYRNEAKDLMLGWSEVAHASSYLLNSETDADVQNVSTTETAHKVTAGNGYTVQAIGNGGINQDIKNGGYAFYLNSEVAAKDAAAVTDPTTVKVTAQDVFANSIAEGDIVITDDKGAEVAKGALNGTTEFTLEDGSYTVTLNNPVVPISAGSLDKNITLAFASGQSQSFTIKGGLVEGSSTDLVLGYNTNLCKVTVQIQDKGVNQAGYLTLEYNDGSAVTDAGIEIPEAGKVLYLATDKEYVFTLTDENGNALGYNTITRTFNQDDEINGEADVIFDVTSTALVINAIDGYTGKPVEATAEFTAATYEDGTTPADLAGLSAVALQPGTYSFEIVSEELSPGVAYKPLVFTDVKIDRNVFYPISVVFVPEAQEQLSSSASATYANGRLEFAPVDNADHYVLKKYAKDGTVTEGTGSDASFSVPDINDYSYFELIAYGADNGAYSPSVTVLTYDKLSNPNVQKPYFNTDSQLVISWGAIANATGYAIAGAATETLPAEQTYFAVENSNDYTVMAQGNMAGAVAAAPGTNRIAMFGDSDAVDVNVAVTVPVTVTLVDGATGAAVPADVAAAAISVQESSILPGGDPADLNALVWGEEYDITVDLENADLVAVLAAEAYEKAEIKNYVARFSNSQLTITLEPSDYIAVSQAPSGKLTAQDDTNYTIEFAAPDVDGKAIDSSTGMSYTLYKEDAKGNLTALTADPYTVAAGTADMKAVFTVAKADLGITDGGDVANLVLKATGVQSGKNYAVSTTRMTVTKLQAPSLNEVVRNDAGDLILSWNQVTAHNYVPTYTVDPEADPTNPVTGAKVKVAAGKEYTVAANGNASAGAANANGIALYLDSAASSSTGVVSSATAVTFTAADIYGNAVTGNVTITGDNLAAPVTVAIGTETELEDGTYTATLTPGNPPIKDATTGSDAVFADTGKETSLTITGGKVVDSSALNFTLAYNPELTKTTVYLTSNGAKVAGDFTLAYDTTTTAYTIDDAEAGLTLYLPAKEYTFTPQANPAQSVKQEVSGTTPVDITLDATTAALSVIAFDGKTLQQVTPTVAVYGKADTDKINPLDATNLPDGDYVADITSAELSAGVVYDPATISQEFTVTDGKVNPIYVTFTPKEAVTLGTSQDAIMYPTAGLFMRSVAHATDAANYTLYGYKANADKTDYTKEKIAVGSDIFDNKYIAFENASNPLASYNTLKEYDFVAMVTEKDADATDNYQPSLTYVNFATLDTPVLNPVYRNTDGDLVLTWGAVANATAYVVTDGDGTETSVNGTSFVVENGKSYTVKALGNFTPDGAKTDTVVKADPATNAISFYHDSAASDSTGTLNVTTPVTFSANMAGTVTVQLANANAAAGSTVELTEANDFSGSLKLADGKYTATFAPATKSETTLFNETVDYTAGDAKTFTVSDGSLQDLTKVAFEAKTAKNVVEVEASVYDNGSAVTDKYVKITKVEPTGTDTKTVVAQVDSLGKTLGKLTVGNYKAVVTTDEKGENVVDGTEQNFAVSAKTVSPVTLNFDIEKVSVPVVVYGKDGASVAASVTFTPKDTTATATTVDIAKYGQYVALDSGEYTVTVAAGKIGEVNYQAYSQDFTVTSAGAFINIELTAVAGKALDPSAQATLAAGANNGDYTLSADKVAGADSYTLTYYSAVGVAGSDITTSVGVDKVTATLDKSKFGTGYYVLTAKAAADSNDTASNTYIFVDTLATPVIDSDLTRNSDNALKMSWSQVDNVVEYAVNDGATTSYTKNNACTVTNNKTYKVTALAYAGNDAAKASVGKLNAATNAIQLYASSAESAELEVAVEAEVTFTANVVGTVTVESKSANGNTTVSLTDANKKRDSLKLADGDYTAKFAADNSTDVALDLGGGTAKMAASDIDFSVKDGVLVGNTEVKFNAAYDKDFVNIAINLQTDMPDVVKGLVISTVSDPATTGTPDNAKYVTDAAELNAKVVTGAKYYIYALDDKKAIIPGSKVEKTFAAGTANAEVTVTVNKARQTLVLQGQDNVAVGMPETEKSATIFKGESAVEGQQVEGYSNMNIPAAGKDVYLAPGTYTLTYAGFTSGIEYNGGAITFTVTYEAQNIPLQLSFDKPQALAPSAWGKLQAGNTVGFAAISAKYDATVVYDVDNSIGRLTSNSFTYTTPAAGQSSVYTLIASSENKKNVTASTTTFTFTTLEAPVASVTGGDAKKAVISWNKVANAAGYVVASGANKQYITSGDILSAQVDYAADYTVTAIGNSHANQADGDYFEIASKDGNIQFYLDSAASGTVTVPAAPPQNITVQADKAGKFSFVSGGTTYDKEVTANTSATVPDTGALNDGEYAATFTWTTDETTTNGTAIKKTASLGKVVVTDGVPNPAVFDLKVAELTDITVESPKFAQVVVNMYQDGTSAPAATYTLSKAEPYGQIVSNPLTSGTELRLEAGTYTATATDDTNVKATITVDADGKTNTPLVTLNVLSHKVFVSFLDGANNSAPAGKVKIGNNEYDIAENGSLITLPAGQYDVEVVTAPTLSAATDTYQDLGTLAQIDLSADKTFAAYTIKYLPKNSQSIAGPTSVKLSKNDANDTYTIEAKGVTEADVTYDLYGVASTGNTTLISGDSNISSFGSLTATDLSKYDAIKVVVKKAATAGVTYVAGEATFVVKQLKAPDAASFMTVIDTNNKLNLLWEPIPGATGYSYSGTYKGTAASTGTVAANSLTDVSEKDKIKVMALGNVNASGLEQATSNNLAPVFYLDSPLSDEYEVPTIPIP